MSSRFSIIGMASISSSRNGRATVHNKVQSFLKRIDHIAVAVENLEEALKFYEAVLGLPCLGIETVAEQGVRVAKLDTGNTHIELLEPLGPDTPVGKFLSQKGQGLHHLCFGVDDINGEL